MTRSKIIWILFILSLTFPLLIYGEIEKPIAQFSFTKGTYQLGEPIEVVESSYSLSGLKIIKREWKVVINGKEKISSYAKSLMDSLKEGEYTLYLRVKDSNGQWSEFVGRKVKITAPKSLNIKTFTTEKSTYAIGEKIQFLYDYDNPNDINLKSQRWRYKNVTTNGSLISGKPTYLKKPGKYEITLEMQDEWGNWSNKKTCYVTIRNEEIIRNGYYLFNKGRQGDLIEGYIDKDYNTFDEALNVEVQDETGTLIMSNSPESVPSSGILYKDTSSGKGIMTVHHKNITSLPKKLVILATSKESTNLKLTISNEAILGPHSNILKTGQSSVSQYFKGKTSKDYIIKPGETVCVYNSATKKAWNNNEIISGLFDFNSTGNVTWTVVMMDEKSDLSNVSKLQVLPRDNHVRGTFNVIERKYVLDLSGIKNPTKLVIGREKEEWLEGTDALTGETIRNQGNYGLPITIEVEGTEDMGVILNARGGAYLGAVKWNQNKVFNVPNEDILSSKKLAALIGKVPKGESREIKYTLPNGSSAPVLFGFIPSSIWK